MLNLSGSEDLRGPAYNERGYAFYMLGEYEKAIADYDQAAGLNVESAVKNREIARGVLNEIRRKNEEKERAEEERRQTEEARRQKEEAEAELRKKEEEIRRIKMAEKERAEEECREAGKQKKAKEAERRKKEEEDRIGTEFSFEVVRVNAKGKIVNRETRTARQKTEDSGFGFKLEMVYIPGGTFTMGSPENEEGRCNDEKQHSVTLSPFYMGKYPVTQAQWEAVMGSSPSNFKGPNRPVENVSWDEAAEFCKKISQKTGKKYRLPTESEWEYACRAGTDTPFYFGKTVTPDLVNYDGNSPYADAPEGKYRPETTEVGIFPPNAFGLYDMHGNVWEWCGDWYGDYPSGAVTDPTGPGIGSARVFRGGCWSYYAGYCRSAYRNRNTPSNRYYNLGFRLVLSSQVSSKGRHRQAGALS